MTNPIVHKRNKINKLGRAEYQAQCGGKFTVLKTFYRDVTCPKCLKFQPESEYNAITKQRPNMLKKNNMIKKLPPATIDKEWAQPDLNRFNAFYKDNYE